MKKQLVFGFLFVTAITLKAQVWSPPGATWYYSYNNFSVTGYVEIKYIGDSLVGGIMTKTLRKVRHWYDYSTTNSGIDTLGNDFTYLSDDTVYYYRFGQFYPLYVFNSNPNDYWTVAGWDPDLFGVCDNTGKIQVDSIGTTIINSDTLKYLKISPKDTSDWQLGSTIIERIGSMDYMFPEPSECLIDVYEGGPLRCYQDSIFGIYQTGIAPACDFITGIKPLTLKNEKIIVYPNPTTGHITLTNLPENDIIRVAIYNILGELVYNQPHTNRQINISEFPEGVYYYTLGNNSEIIAGGKLIIQ